MEHSRTKSRNYTTGMGQAVADRTINRKKDNGKHESWEDVALRVAKGNAMLNQEDESAEFRKSINRRTGCSTLLFGHATDRHFSV